MIYDVFTYNGENEILKLHLSILNDYVDKFIIVESDKTFTGNAKPLCFFRDQRYFKKWWKKIIYYPVTEWDDIGLWQQAFESPNTKGAEHWKREFYIKESIKKALVANNIQDDDLLFIGDVDEIIDPTAHLESDTPIKAKLRVYSYYLNNRTDEEFYGTLITQYKDIKDVCLNHMRSDTSLYAKDQYLGWHFTSMGGIDAVHRKLDDSYTRESYNMNIVPGHVEWCLENRMDLLNRPFVHTIDESEWPALLTTERSKYKEFLW